MSLNTNLLGRLRNTPLPRSHGLMPVFEAVVNSIHSIAEVNTDATYGEIEIEIIRAPQSSLALEDIKNKRGAPPQEHIVGFKIVDNGEGFHDKNMKSFETLDSDHKAKQGCRGVGRLSWLKVFDAVAISSNFVGDGGVVNERSFAFTPAQGVHNITVTEEDSNLQRKTSIHLTGFNSLYREKSPKTAGTIANSLFEHCLWYFVRDGGAPKICIKDDFEVIRLDQVYEDYMFSSSKKECVTVKGRDFELTHLKLKTSVAKQPYIAWCAASRVVEEESIAGKVPGLHGKIKDDEGDFVYACYVTSPFLDEHVRPERIGFDIEAMSDSLFSETELSLAEIRNEVIAASRKHLDAYLQESQRAGRERVEKFVAQSAPRYRPILKRIDDAKLSVDPDISDKDLDLLLHKQLSEIEGSLLSEGSAIMTFGAGESPAEYQTRLAGYLAKVDDIKKSDLANYVFHRKIILDILEKAIQRGVDGKYAREELIHELIMPMRKTSDEITLDSCNLWLIDERLAFHNFLASDKPLSTMPIAGNSETKKPDICALNVYDEPILVAAGQEMPLASIVIVEIKRPMRNDAAAGEDKDPVEQALGYLARIRDGGTTTSRGRPIPSSGEIPGFCYVVCDLTPTVKSRCRIFNLTETSDRLGYFGYNANFKAYIEVISFDRLLNAAKQRNKAFFDRLCLPTT